MNAEEPDLRRALGARSGRPTPEFRARFASALSAGRPASSSAPRLALAVAMVLAVAVVGVLLMSRQGGRALPPPGAASGPRIVTTPLPTPSGCVFCPIQMPTYAVLSAPSDNVVWALVQGEYLARSTDRGTTWEQRPLPKFEGGFPPPEISFIDDHEGWLATGGSPATQCSFQTTAMWHTSDAGATWNQVGTTGIGTSQCKGMLSFVDHNRGFIDGFDPNHAPVIYRTTDGGRTWAPSKPLPDPPGFTSQGGGFTLQPGPVRAFGPTLLVQASMNNSEGYVQAVFSSGDGGATWSYVARREGLLVFLTSTRWLQVNIDQPSWETTDAGRSWHAYASDYTQAAGVAPDVVFADSAVGYATVRGSIARTIDGGHHWVWIGTPGT